MVARHLPAPGSWPDKAAGDEAGVPVAVRDLPLKPLPGPSSRRAVIVSVPGMILRGRQPGSPRPFGAAD
jgi:hypothetical protein